MSTLTAGTRPLDAAARPNSAKWLVAIAVMSSAVMEVLDTSVVNVSMPHIAGSLGATVDEATWVLTSYIVANAVILPISGWLANYFGRKRLLLTVVTGFTISSMLCGLAPNLPMLILFRVLQGTTGGGLQPLSQAVLLEEFPPEERGKAMGFWGLGIVAAPILGPTLGGWLTDTYSWRWVFYINLPVGILSFLMISLFLYDPPYIRRGTLRADFVGFGMLAIGMGSLQIMLDKGQEDDWFSSRFIITLAILAVVFLAGFVLRQLQTPDPLVHLRLLKYRTFLAGIIIITVMGFVLYGQPDSAAAVHADSAGMDSRDGRHLDQSARHRYGHLHAHCRLSPGQAPGRTLSGGGRLPGRRARVLRVRAYDAAVRHVGHLLGPDRAGRGHGVHLCAADHADHGADPARRDRLCRQLVQRDAQHRVERGYFICDHLGGAARAVSSGNSLVQRHAVQPAGAADAASVAIGVHARGRGSEHRHAPGAGRALWDGAAAGLAAELCGCLSHHGLALHHSHARRLSDEEGARRRWRQRCCSALIEMVRGALL